MIHHTYLDPEYDMSEGTPLCSPGKPSKGRQHTCPKCGSLWKARSRDGRYVWILYRDGPKEK